jgi:hypothetical protein
MALLCPARPIGHQSIALVQRALEQRGLATVSMSVAPDVSTEVKPPRVGFAPFMIGPTSACRFTRRCSGE